MKIFSALAILLSVSITTLAQTTQKLTATKLSEYGLIYNLPSTVFDITIEAECIEKEPGEYYKYAKKYLDTNNAIAEASRSWSVKSIIITPRGVANPDERYLMQFKKGTSPFLIVNEENMPLAINTENIPEQKAPELPTPVAPSATPLDGNAAQHVISQEMLQSQSSAKRAELAATQIFTLRQSRTDIMTGQAEQMPPDGQAMQLVLDNLSSQEAALTAMFMGTERRYTDVKTFRFTPDTISSEKIIARISSLNGIVDTYDLSGEPVYLSLEITERGELPKNEKTGLTKQFPKGGVAYRIPGKANIKLEYGGKVFVDETFNVAQYGVVFGIDPALFTTKTAPAYLIFDALTGGIKELGTVSE